MSLSASLSLTSQESQRRHAPSIAYSATNPVRSCAQVGTNLHEALFTAYEDEERCMRGNRMSKFAIFIGTWNTTGEIRAIGKEARPSRGDGYVQLDARQSLHHSRCRRAHGRYRRTLHGDHRLRRAKAQVSRPGVRRPGRISGLRRRFARQEVEHPRPHAAIQRRVRPQRRQTHGSVGDEERQARWQPWIDLQLVRA